MLLFRTCSLVQWKVKSLTISNLPDVNFLRARLVAYNLGSHPRDGASERHSDAFVCPFTACAKVWDLDNVIASYQHAETCATQCHCELSTRWNTCNKNKLNSIHLTESVGFTDDVMILAVSSASGWGQGFRPSKTCDPCKLHIFRNLW